MKFLLPISIFLFVESTFIFSQRKTIDIHYLNEPPPDSIPLVFGKGIISTKDYVHSSPVFSPNNKEIYWSIRINGEYGKEIIKYVYKENNTWSEPKIPSFSIMSKGDLYPTFFTNGKEIYFTSDRPDPSKPDSICRYIWKVLRNGNDWLVPEIVGFDSLDIYGFSISQKGSLYFMAQHAKERGTNKFDIYYSELENCIYKSPEKLDAPISTEYYEDNPFISQDEKFLLFESNRPGSIGKLDLYISTKADDGKWSLPRNLGKPINSESSERFPYISPDGKYFFFASDRSGDNYIYWVNNTVISKQVNN